MPGIDETRQFVPLKIAVLTVSDTRELADDKSGNTLVERIRAAGHVLAERAIVKDEVKAIRQRVKAWVADKFIDVVITTGGTGFTGRDVTPEATKAVLDREIPGFGELMRSRGRESTPLAVLSRSLAGTRGSVLIVNLPGSPKGAVESLDAIVELVPHVLELLGGHTEHVGARQE